MGLEVEEGRWGELGEGEEEEVGEVVGVVVGVGVGVVEEGRRVCYGARTPKPPLPLPPPPPLLARLPPAAIATATAQARC